MSFRNSRVGFLCALYTAMMLCLHYSFRQLIYTKCYKNDLSIFGVELISRNRMWCCYIESQCENYGNYSQGFALIKTNFILHFSIERKYFVFSYCMCSKISLYTFKNLGKFSRREKFREFKCMKFLHWVCDYSIVLVYLELAVPVLYICSISMDFTTFFNNFFTY